MLACTAMLVGCSDDDVLNNNELDKPQAEKMEAYLTFSIASSTNSSRGVNEGNTLGDGHGDEESSGHTNAGTVNENNVKSVMIVYYNTDDETAAGDGLAATYELPGEGEAKTGITYNSADETYSPDEPYELDAIGTYNVLVVLNPNTDLKAKAAINSMTAKNVYDYILGGTSNEVNAVSGVIGTNSDEFMMTNKTKISIEVTPANNTPENAATPKDKSGNDAIIEVERVASKITFRPTTFQGFSTSGFVENSELENGVNVYGIDYTPYTYSYNKDNYWLQNSDGTYKYLIGLYPAKTTDGSNKNILVYINSDKSRTCYELDANNTTPHEGYVDGMDGIQKGRIVVPFTYAGTVLYTGGTATAGDKLTYYVKLKNYALTNLNNAINYVRHTSANASDAIAINNAFGTVNSSTYLLDPNTASKSGNVTAVNNGLLDFTNNNTGTTWFGSTAFKTVTEQIENGTSSNLFATLPGSNNDDNQYGEEGSLGNVEGTTNENPDDTHIGSLLSYCLENSVVVTNQNPLLTTGIIFEAQIYNNKGEIVPLMYHVKHGDEDQFYSNLASLVESTGKENSIWYAYTDEEYNLNTLTDEKVTELQEAGINVYKDGKCYYFSSQIKHFDYGEKDKGVMEYAIMRNNIYSLEVSSVDGFGFSSLDLESNILQSEEKLEKVYLTMKAKILPWIVRFNNIQF